ncbi:tetratricopeptide repeat protein [Reichenbachiella versicolor]|uniref:tetratricopeptide repeat protein n=1 Tax=Reichenbachiella versicolor TaxID=1821036 RepID=UPI0013A58A65|nr:hypothetical protein [Reichenbachiella versicolor]
MEYLRIVTELKYTEPDSSQAMLGEALGIFQAQNDTLNIIKTFVAQSDLNAHFGEFGKAYDRYWEALLLAETINHDNARASVYSGLGWLYILYNRKDEAIKYFNYSIHIHKRMIFDMRLDPQVLMNDYYALATFYRKRDNLQMAKIYLDSCIAVSARTNVNLIDRPFIRAELGYQSYLRGEYKKALDQLLAVEERFREYSPGYLVILHHFIGLIYMEMGQYRNSEKSFLTSIEANKNYRSHHDMMHLIHFDLAELYSKMAKYKPAYEALMISKNLSEESFGSLSSINSEFLEIKDEFRIHTEQKLKREQEIENQRLKQQQKISNLQLLILSSATLTLILSIIFIYRFLRIKYKAKRKMLEHKREVDREKSKEVLEIKNKELISSALQVIQKEELLSELKEQLLTLKKTPDKNKINKLARSIQINSDNNWEEFEARFVSVNTRFYTDLNNKFPKLSQGDQKICALIKLNFSSKDMAKLLGICVESVHTTRYRLRKKLGLERSDNLEDFIANIG